MATIPSDPAAAPAIVRRTFANVAAAASAPAPTPAQQPMESALPNGNTSNIHPTNTAGNMGASADDSRSHAQVPQPETLRISPVIPRKLTRPPSRSPETPMGTLPIGPKLLVQSPGTPPTSQTAMGETMSLNANLCSVASDENSTQLSSSDSSAKPPSVDGKSVASATTFAMDEKESLRPDDSASVKASIEDEEVFSPPGSAALGSRLGSDSGGARAFRDQLQEITAMGGQSHDARTGSLPAANVVPSGLLFNPSAMPPPTQMPGFVQPAPNVTGEPGEFPPDAKLLDALTSPRDRIWVLKLEQDIIDFVKDPKENALDLPQCNSFYRMLAHKLADYYLLGHAVDNTVSAVRLYKTSTCRIAPPLTAITQPSTATSTPPPSAPPMKILRRGGEAPYNGLSKSASDADSASDGDKNKAPLTREQREQRYEEARLRILGSAKPTEDAPAPKERDDSRSSSAAGNKKKARKQRTNSDDGFEARSAFSIHNPSYSQSGPSDAGAAGTFYPSFPENGPGGYNATGGMYSQQNPYNSVYGGQQMSSQVGPYPWLQQGYSGYNDPNGQAWAQQQSNGNDLAADFQQMSFQNGSGSSPPLQGSPYGYGPPQAPNWSPGMQYQPGYPMPNGYGPQFGGQSRASTSHGPAPPSGQYQWMNSQYMGYPNQTMSAGYGRPVFNPNSQAFVPGQQNMNGPHAFSTGMTPPNHGNFGGSYHGQNMLQRQNSTQSQASSYSGSRAMHDGNNMRGNSGAGMTHPLPQPVFSPNVPMPSFQNAQRQPMTPAKTGSNAPSDKSPSTASTSGSTIAKWGAPSSLPAKPPPPAMESYGQGQRGGGFNAAAAARLPGVGGPGFAQLPSMMGIRSEGSNVNSAGRGQN